MSDFVLANCQLRRVGMKFSLVPFAMMQIPVPYVMAASGAGAEGPDFSERQQSGGMVVIRAFPD